MSKRCGFRRKPLYTDRLQTESFSLAQTGRNLPESAESCLGISWDLPTSSSIEKEDDIKNRTFSKFEIERNSVDFEAVLKNPEIFLSRWLQ